MNLYSIIPALGTGLAAVFGLGMWQYQLIAKRRYEVVEQALIAAGEVVQTLHFIRQSGADDAAAAEQHPDGVRPGPWLTAYGRIQGAETQLANLRNSRSSIAMHFGDSQTKSFDALLKIFDELCQAQASLYFRQAPQKLYPTAEHLKDVETWKGILNPQGGDDKITQKINALHSEVKSKFGKYLRPNPFRLFLPFWKQWGRLK